MTNRGKLFKTLFKIQKERTIQNKISFVTKLKMFKLLNLEIEAKTKNDSFDFLR